jgi:hypothetical protein
MNTYEIRQTIDGVDYLEMITPDGVVSFVPTDPANSDYQAYLLSLEPANDKS